MKIVGIDYTDKSLIPAYRDPNVCRRCLGDGVVPCDECDGRGWYDVDGLRVTCTNRGCVDGLRPCVECDGSGHEL